MVRLKVMSGTRLACAVGSALAAVAITVSAAGQAQEAATASGPLDALLQRAATTAPGTYAINGSAISPAATPVPALVQADVLRGPNRTIRVPIVVGADVPQSAAVRLRVVTNVAAGQTPRVVGTASGSGSAGRMRFIHEFVLPPGDYESQAVVGDARTGVPVNAALAKAKFTVPDVWGTALVATPIVLGDEAGAARRGEVQPFSFGPTMLVPSVKGQFPQSASVRAAFRIFNWSAKAEEQPDLTVDYLFYERGTKGLHLFNKMKPQRLTAAPGDATDTAAGMLSAGKLFPLGSFTFGEFQLKVTVTDNRSKQSAERVVGFTVAP